MSDIVLSKGVRQNLLALQNTAALLSRTQERLATGKKVNSALDNPINFFTSAGLQARANDLNRLLDSISNAVQTIQAADKGITAITKLVETAQATARQALQAALPGVAAPGGGGGGGGGNPTTAVATGSETFDAEAVATGGADLSSFDYKTLTGTLAITIGEETLTITFAAADPDDGTVFIDTDDASDDVRDALLNAINTEFGPGTAALVGNNLVITASADITIADSAAKDALFVNDANDIEVAATHELDAPLTGNLNISIGDEDFVIDLTGLDTLEEVVDAINGTTGFSAVATASISDDGALVITAENAGEDITFPEGEVGDIDAEAVFGLTDATAPEAGEDDDDDETPTPPANGLTGAALIRDNLQKDYNLILDQITELARDASFNGVNLINGNDLKVIFNEDGTSSLTIKSVTFTFAGLGLSKLTGTEFQTNAGVDAAIAKLDAATSKLRSQASAFGSNLSIIQARQDFTKNMVTVLQIGADNLVLADSNEEGANMLALNTRQQLSTVALSLAAQADQNVLRLF